jgi:hypothetical protein
MVRNEYERRHGDEDEDEVKVISERNKRMCEVDLIYGQIQI